MAVCRKTPPKSDGGGFPQSRIKLWQGLSMSTIVNYHCHPHFVNHSHKLQWLQCPIDQNNFVHQHIVTNDNLFQKVFLTRSMFRCDPLSWWWASPPGSRKVTGWSRYWPFEFYETWNKIVFSFKYLSNEAAAQARQLLDNRDLDGFCLQVQLGNASGDNRSINTAIRLLLLLPWICWWQKSQTRHVNLLSDFIFSL